ncbi:hypothetical protein [Cytobacillus gottheilii]|uniref:Uncharacterized protein n=1 Tax=Cytobacillus gottheilii TaxID=859144 RepID=A0ABX8F969_9BACI|nr:hypothetical protein [Cytobacillus gottheilii]QVY60963.1 hypothetical protein J1899_18630 [Cytobacillus gottheilii]
MAKYIIEEEKVITIRGEIEANNAQEAVLSFKNQHLNKRTVYELTENSQTVVKEVQS